MLLRFGRCISGTAAGTVAAVSILLVTGFLFFRIGIFRKCVNLVLLYFRSTLDCYNNITVGKRLHTSFKISHNLP